MPYALKKYKKNLFPYFRIVVLVEDVGFEAGFVGDVGLDVDVALVGEDETGCVDDSLCARGRLTTLSCVKVSL